MKRLIPYFLSLFFVVSLASVSLEARGRPPRAGQPAAQGHDPVRAQPAHSRAPSQAVRAESERKTTADLLQQNQRLNTRLESMLPPGSNPQAAAAGFKNLGQFVSAVHASRNLNIPFDQLKGRMTGPDAVSLGKAIKELKPGVDAKAEAKKAEKQAKKDLKESGA
ncbi:MAG: hypothetical protein ACRD4D_06305 [Candidatus Acidiferrales bacterium]